MPTSRHDRELRALFNYSRRSFTSIAKNPGYKFNFKMKHYVLPDDSIDTVRNVLTRIRDVQYYAKTSMFGYLTRQLKADLKRELDERKPQQYELHCHVGILVQYYCQRDETLKWDTNRSMHFVLRCKHSRSMVDKLLATTTLATFKVYHGVPVVDGQPNAPGTPVQAYVVPTGWRGDVEKEIMARLETSGSKLVEFWFEEKPNPSFEVKFSRDMRICQIQDEGLERASVLTDNFLKHAGGVHIKARDDTDGQCVDHQLLDIFLRPGYTDPISTIPTEWRSTRHVPLTPTSLTAYLDTLPDAKPPGRTPPQLALMCVDLQLNMYALDADSHCFLKITQFAGRHHHALCFYAVHKHFSLIVHPETASNRLQRRARTRVMHAASDRATRKRTRTHRRRQDRARLCAALPRFFCRLAGGVWITAPIISHAPMNATRVRGMQACYR